MVSIITVVYTFLVFPFLENLTIKGGYNGSQNVEETCNSLWKYSMRSNKWVLLNKPNAPSNRSYHFSFIRDGKMCILGGHTANVDNNIYYFDFKKQVWTNRSTSGRIPEVLQRTRAVIHNDNLYVFGGNSGMHCLFNF